MKTILAILSFFAFIFSACALNQVESQNQTPVNSTAISVRSENSDVEPKDDTITDKRIPVVKPSNLIERLRKKKTETPKISAKELADYGNVILKKDGYDYTFDWERKGKKNEENLGKLNSENYLPFEYKFITVSGKEQKLQLLNNGFDHPCFSTIDIPVTKINEQTMTVISEGKEIELKRPHDFYLEEFVLVDKSKKPIRKWKTPIDYTPVGISEDGTKIYFDSYEFSEDENDSGKESPINLAVEISEAGSLRLVDINEIKSDKGVEIGYDKKHTEIIYEKYKVGNKEYIIKYSAPCT